MPNEQIKDLGTGGWNSDTPPMILPQNTFTDVLNVRFDDNAVSCMTGETTSRVLPIAADYGIHWRRPDQGYNIYGRDGIFYRIDSAGGSSLMLNSISSDYTNSDWHGTLFNGGYAIVINNGKSTPLYCLYGDAVAGNSFQPLPNWNYIGGLVVYAKVVRALNYSLVAANLTLTQGAVVTSAPGTIRVSVQAATGAIPAIWQPGLTTDTADEFELSSTSPILDMMDLRGNMFVYSSDSISILYIGTTTRVSPYSKSYGILSSDCVIEYDGNHLVVDRNDIYTHNGSGAIKSLADYRIKKYFFANLNQDYIYKVHLVKNSFYKEIWVNYPKGTSTICNEAIVYNYKNDTWTRRQLANVSYSFTGPSNDSNAYQYGKEIVYMTTGTTQTLKTDTGYLMWNGAGLTSFTSYIEKKKLNTGDVSGSTLISSLYPIFDNVPLTSNITVRVVGQNNYTADHDLSVHDTTLKDTFTFLPNILPSQGYKVDPRVNGRLLNYRISATDYWRLAAFAIDARPADRR